MSLDAVKMFFQVERNKLIGIGVASCLVTTAIVAPAAYFGGQPSKKGVINPVAFNTISATGEHLADYGNLDVIGDGDKGWGNEENISYVTSDQDLTKNVLNIDNGIGFQAENVAKDQAETLKSDINVMSAEFGEGETKKYVDPDDPSTDEYELVAPINIYMRVPAPVSIFLKENLMFAPDVKTGEVGTKTIWEKGVTSTSDLVGYDDGVHKEALDSYFGWANSNGYLDDFMMAYTFFNWMLFNPLGVDQGYPAAPDEAKNPDVAFSEKDFQDSVINMIDNVKEITPNKEVVIDDSTMNVQISGTGTDKPYIDKQSASFNEANAEWIVDQYGENENVNAGSIITPLTNEGSSTAWYMPSGEIAFDTNGETRGGEWSLEGDSLDSSLPPDNAFIGTQSRRSHYGVYDNGKGEDDSKSISGMSQWGYGYQSTVLTPGSEEWNYMEQPDVKDITETNEEIMFGQQEVGVGRRSAYADEAPWNYKNEISNTGMALPLGFTATTDPLVFFTNDDTTFKHGKDTYKPSGMTPIGTKLIFENPLQQDNLTWDLLYSAGYIDAVKV